VRGKVRKPFEEVRIGATPTGE